jgi:quinol monooxygenase YgiN
MIFLEITFKVSNADIDNFRNAARQVAHASKSENGCEEYVFSVDLDLPTQFYLLEQWQSEASLRAHYQTQHFLMFSAFLRDIKCERTRRARSGDLQPWQMQPSV